MHLEAMIYFRVTVCQKLRRSVHAVLSYKTKSSERFLKYKATNARHLLLHKWRKLCDRCQFFFPVFAFKTTEKCGRIWTEF